MRGSVSAGWSESLLFSNPKDRVSQAQLRVYRFRDRFCVRVVKNLSPRRFDRAMIVRICDQYQHRIRFLICIDSEVLPSSKDRPMFADQLQMLYVNGLN